MKKKLLWIFGVLGVNILTGIFCPIPFFSFLTRDDPILSCALLIPVLPPIILQPWFVLFFFLLPFSILWAPLLTTLTTVIVYGLLNQGGQLDRPKRFLSRFKTRKTLIAAGGCILALAIVVYARYSDFPAMHHESPPQVDISNLNVSDNRLYCLGSFIDSEWLWRARISAPDMDRVVERFELRPLNQSEAPNAFRNMPPYWWRPAFTGSTQIFSTRDFPMNGRGPDGWHAIAAWNPDDQFIYMWIKDNF